MIMNIGKYILAQVIDFIPRYQFDKLVKMHKGDWHAKDLSCYNQLLHLLFGQITGCVSIRDISSMRLTPQLSQQALFWLHGHWASIAKAQTKCTNCWIFVEAFQQISILQIENGMTAMNWMRLCLSHLRSI